MTESKKIYSIKERLEKVTSIYCMRFAKKHALPDFEGWVSGKAATTAFFGAIAVNFDEIQIDIDEHLHPSIWEGYHKMCESSHEDCNFNSYILGWRPQGKLPFLHRLIVKYLKAYLTYYCKRLIMAARQNEKDRNEPKNEGCSGVVNA